MKFLLALALAPVLAFADCAGSLKGLIVPYSWLMNAAGADPEVAKMCADQTLQDALLSDLDAVIVECGGSVGTLGPILDLVKDVMCDTEVDDADVAQYCLPSLLAMVPFVDLIGAKTAEDLMAIDFTKNLKIEASQELICRTEHCSQKIIHKAAKAIRKVGVDIPIVMSLVLSAQSACIKVGDKLCWDKDTEFFLDDGAVDVAKACDGKKMMPCFQKIASVEFPLKAPKGLCKPDGEPKAVGKAVLKLAGLAYDYFVANKDDIMTAIERDLGFNIPALLPHNMEIAITASTDEPPSLLIDVTFMGEELISVDIDLEMLIKLFEELLKTGNIVSLPFLENLHIDAASLLGVAGTTGMLADSLSFESMEMDTAVVPPVDDDVKKTDDNASAGVCTSVGASVGLVVAAAAIAL